MVKRRIRLALVMPIALYLSWLGMMAVHELGHVLGAIVSGGTVQRVVLPLIGFSRTDVDPNPHPLIEVWAGPLVGWALPMIATLLLVLRKSRVTKAAMFFAGFCGIANGAYIGSGVWMPVGDAKVLRAHGSPAWTLALAGIVMTCTGLWIWHAIGKTRMRATHLRWPIPNEEVI